MLKVIIAAAALSLSCCTSNKNMQKFEAGDANNGGVSGSISYVGTQYNFGKPEADASLLVEKVVLKSSSADVWHFTEKSLIQKLLQSVHVPEGTSKPTDPSQVLPEHVCYVKEGAPLFELNSREQGSSPLPNAVITFYVRNTGTKSMTLYGLKSEHNVLCEAGATGATPITSFNKGAKLSFSYARPYKLDFAEPLSLPAGETTGIELELGFEEIKPHETCSMFDVSLYFHNGSRNIGGTLCYLEY